jgi:hypothetical protein
MPKYPLTSKENSRRIRTAIRRFSSESGILSASEMNQMRKTNTTATSAAR